LSCLTVIGFLALWSSPTLGVLMVFQVVRRGMHLAPGPAGAGVAVHGGLSGREVQVQEVIDTAV